MIYENYCFSWSVGTKLNVELKYFNIVYLFHLENRQGYFIFWKKIGSGIYINVYTSM